MDTPDTRPSVQTVIDQPEQLYRAITAPLLFFYVLGDVLGSGIYALVGTMAGQVGGAFWTSFAVGVAAAMLTGFAYAEWPGDGGLGERLIGEVLDGEKTATCCPAPTTTRTSWRR